MKKRRAWSTLDDEADAQESAALAASLATAKDTAARSGALLSRTKEDLTDHQRWLRAQSAAVERDRDRHERWLQRQKDLRLANANKDRVRRHRRLVRQRALQAIRQAFVDLFVFIRSWIAFGAGNVAGGALSAGRSIGAAVVLAGQGMAERTRRTGRKIALAMQEASSGIAACLAWGFSKASASVRGGSQLLAAGGQALAQRAGSLSHKTGFAIGCGGHAVNNGARSLGSGFASTSHSAQALASATRESVASGAVASAAKSAELVAVGGQKISAASAWAVSHLAAVPSKLFIYVARLGNEVQHFARVRVPEQGAAELPPGLHAASSLGSAFDKHESMHSDQPPETSDIQTASVHVFETYGPHPDGTTLFGQPANNPWMDDASSIARPEESSTLDVAANAANHVSLPAVVTGALISGFAAKTKGVRSALSDGANGGVRALMGAVQHYAGAGSAWLRSQAAGVFTAAQAGSARLIHAQEVAVARSNDWAVKRGLDPSHMMIIAGSVLLLLGGLLIGGGFLMRSASGPLISQGPSEETFSKITWAYDHPDLPLPERAIFTLSGTPQSFLLNGISISGMNNSDEVLTNLEAVLRPDVRRPDLPLGVALVPKDGGAVSVGTAASVPPDTSFALSFQFPPEAMGSADGISVEEFFESYGGLLLRIRYTADGAERSILQYLNPEMLKAQLEEVTAQASGS